MVPGTKSAVLEKIIIRGNPNIELSNTLEAKETVLEKALSTNAGMDACLGFYDEYYDFYDIEAEPMVVGWESICLISPY